MENVVLEAQEKWGYFLGMWSKNMGILGTTWPKPNRILHSNLQMAMIETCQSLLYCCWLVGGSFPQVIHMIWSIWILIVADCNFNCWCSTVEFYHVPWLNMGFPKVCDFNFRRSTVDFYHAWWINMDFPKVFENVNSEYPASMRSLGHRLRRRPWSSWSTRSQRHSACGVWACGWSCKWSFFYNFPLPEATEKGEKKVTPRMVNNLCYW